MNSLVRFAIENGGNDIVILCPNHLLMGCYSSGNPTCCYFHNKIFINSRLVDYKKILQSEYTDFISNGMNQTYYLNDNGFTSRNVVCEYNRDSFSNHHETYYGNGYNSYYKGLEDCRFVVWDNKLYAYGTRWDRLPDGGCIGIYELEDDMKTYKREIIVRSPFNAYCEKNWGAIEDKPFHFIYKANETIVVRVTTNGNCQIVQNNGDDKRFESTIKGSTPVIRYNADEYISIVHRTITDNSGAINKLIYQSAFIFYDNTLHITRMSEWFVFRTELCEFTCGLSIHDGMIYIPYSQIDCTANLLSLPLNKIEDFMQGGEWPIYDRDYVHAIANYYEKNEQYCTSSVLYNYCAILSENNDIIKLESILKAFAGILSELDSIKSSVDFPKLRKCIEKFKYQFADINDFDYLLSIIDRYHVVNDNKPIGSYLRLHTHELDNYVPTKT